MSHRMQASVEPDILRATPEMESKMQHHHHHQHHYHEDTGNKRRITTDSWQLTNDTCCHLFDCAELVSWYTAMYGANEEED